MYFLTSAVKALPVDFIDQMTLYQRYHLKRSYLGLTLISQYFIYIFNTSFMIPMDPDLIFNHFKSGSR